MSYFRGSSHPRDRTWVSYLLHCQAGSLALAPPEKPGRATGETNVCYSSALVLYFSLRITVPL